MTTAEASTLITVPACGTGTGTIRLVTEFICVHVLDGIHFDFDYCFVRPEGKPIIKEIVEAINEEPERRVLLVGHTDRSGLNAYNQALSRRRARSVFAYTTGDVDGWMELLRTMMSSPGSDTTPRAGVGQSFDRWQTREIQYMLSTIRRPDSSESYYGGPINNIFTPATQDSLDAFRADNSLPAGGGTGPRRAGVDEDTWRKLFEHYITQDAQSVDTGRFLDPALIGCGEHFPRFETRAPGTESQDLRDAEARLEVNRRVEFLLIPPALVPAQITCEAMLRNPDSPIVICPGDPQPISAMLHFTVGDSRRPRAGLDVNISGRGGFTRRQTADEQGKIRLENEITQGDYRLTVADEFELALRDPSQGHAQGNQATLHLTKSTAVDIMTTLLGQTITVRVELQDEYGQPFVGSFDLTQPSGEVLHGEETDTQGHWSRDDMPPGEYTITIQDQFISLSE